MTNLYDVLELLPPEHQLWIVDGIKAEFEASNSPDERLIIHCVALVASFRNWQREDDQDLCTSYVQLIMHGCLEIDQHLTKYPTDAFAHVDAITQEMRSSVEKLNRKEST